MLHQVTLTGSNTEPGDAFGNAIALHGDTMIVGAQFEDGSGIGVNTIDNNGATDTGAAYIFVRTGTAWTQSRSKS
ncbi:MAG: FG-GAP repeat protein [Polyangiales bacterium]